MADGDATKLVFGTAGLGMAYGLPAREGDVVSRPDAARARATCEAAWEAGFRIADTAPAYGVAESLVGEYWPGLVWTKCGDDGIDGSLRRLRRDRVDAVQWHNWSAELSGTRAFDGWYAEALSDERVGIVGATVYGEEDAIAAARLPFALVQVPWNCCDQRVASAAGRERSKSVKVAGRSVYLQGILAGRRRPSAVVPGTAALDLFFATAAMLELDPAVLALRAALDCADLDYVLVGLADPSEVESVLSALDTASLPDQAWDVLRGCNASGEPWADPRTWGH